MKLNKKQKRTATIASMAALLAVVLGMGGQTFAKYITTNTATAQSATVAKWGLVLNQQTSDETLFKNNYDDSVVSSTSKVVAPGTTGYVTYFIDGSAEVDAQVTFSLEKYSGVSLTQGTTVEYNPIKWTYQYGTTGEKTPFTPEEGLKLPVQKYEAGESTSIVVTLEWTWAFENKGEAANNHINDKYDTILGYASMAGKTEFTYSKADYQEGDDLEYKVDYTLDFQFKAVIEQLD